MDDTKRGFKEGVEAARYFGSEFQANPGSDKMEYLDAIADYFREDATWKDLTNKEKEAAKEAFRKGVEAEKRLQ